jgi:hypothetical protein
MSINQYPSPMCLCVPMCLVTGFAKPEGGSGGYARYIAICPPNWQYGTSVIENPGAPLPKQACPLRRDERGVLRPTHQ